MPEPLTMIVASVFCFFKWEKCINEKNVVVMLSKIVFRGLVSLFYEMVFFLEFSDINL